MVDEENADRSCWLPEDEVAITPERIKALGLTIEMDEDGNAMMARADRLDNIMRFLHQEKFIGDQELFDGDEFILWRQLFRVFCVGEKRNGAYSAKGTQGGEGTRERGFFLLLHRMSPRYYRIVEYAVDNAATSSAMKMEVRINSGRFTDAFSRLSSLMQGIREELKPTQPTKETPDDQPA